MCFCNRQCWGSLTMGDLSKSSESVKQNDIVYIYILIYTNVDNFYQDTRSTLGLQLWDQSIPGAPLLRSLFSTEPKKWFEGHHVCISCSGGVLKSSKTVKGKALSLERLGFHFKNYIGGGFKYLLFSSRKWSKLTSNFRGRKSLLSITIDYCGLSLIFTWAFW